MKTVLHLTAMLCKMFSCVLSRSVCQVVAGLSGRCYPTSGALFRAFTTSQTKYCETSGSDSVVTYEQLKSMLSKHDIQLFDVRNPDEFQAGSIPQAVNIPLGDLEESLKLPPEPFQQNFKVKAPAKDDDNIVLQCRRGNRSATALVIARQLGFSRVRHYKGGYDEWAEREGK